MLLTINITNISYENGDSLSFDAIITRDDDGSHIATLTSGSVGSLDFTTQTIDSIYKKNADICSDFMDSTYSTSISKSELIYIFLGLSIRGPFHNLPSPTELIPGVL